MRFRFLAAVVAAGLLGAAGCGPHESAEQRQHDANTVAGKIGQMAHRAAVEADKLGQVLGRQLDKAAHDAREGWKEDERKHAGK